MLEEIFDHCMKITSDSLKFGEATSVAKKERFEKDIVTQTKEELKSVLSLNILCHFNPKNSNQEKIKSGKYTNLRDYFVWHQTSFLACFC